MRTKQSGHDRLAARRRRMLSVALFRAACPSLEGLTDRLRWRVTRWRNGTSTSAIEDLDELIGCLGPVEARLLIEHLEDTYEEHHGDTSADLLAAFMLEQEADGAEDVIQMRAISDHAALGLWAERSLLHAARARVARAAIRRETMRPRDRAA